MKHQLSKISALDTIKALKEAEADLVRPEGSDGKPVYAHVPPQDIAERLELFQPRRPGYGLRKVDTQHVNALATRITRKGELDPVLVVKLGSKWVVVDGHHRIAAYQKLKYKAPIKCEWFAGTVREAMDESLRRNEKTHLRVEQADKAEAAWTRTLMDWDGKGWSSSKAQVVTLTGASDGTVAQMRRVVKWHDNYKTGVDKHPTGEKLFRALGPDLRRHSWNKAKMVLLDLAPKEWDMNDAAAKLARGLVTRMTTKLSEDPEVTARALWLYDRDLCPNLVKALQDVMRSEKEAEGDEEFWEPYKRVGLVSDD
ncbi:ParB-like nuclease domain-containing protein [Bradyrhizobium sp. Ghvi]|uniref:ParB/RepB/Spo0J family partition protein n=1 Tax=Bradyrhizobium sp. Ghvi TaxID=1855319 RepID=UPI0008E59638|nr:ParB/RepB/Spo0J family partition protein [Bradyrhizobium sp. Ghvi]SFN95487.1 ParB-like nuclease domain-containing protein [Bradyrhizobium sp. Ghvi]